MRRRWTTVLGFILSLSWAPIRGQVTGNMVYNPSFEEHTDCPARVDALGVMKIVDAWWQPTRGSSDYFHACGGRECQVPRNKMGMQPAHTGEAYCGIYCSQETYREYLQTELRTPLQAGRRYRISFWISLADKSPHATAAIGALLTAERVEDSTWGILMHREASSLESGAAQYIATYVEPQIASPAGQLLDNMKEWMEVGGEMVAEGGERFLTIGNFLPFNKSGVTLLDNSYAPLSGAYYYIDDVSVVSLDSSSTVASVASPPPQAGMVSRLENILFVSGESEILQQSYKELQGLRDMLLTYPEVKIQLIGHTDDRGTVEYNQKLSERRAKEVVDYLSRRGVDRRRMSWIGYGESQPIATNETEEGRRINRRVEYLVMP